MIVKRCNAYRFPFLPLFPFVPFLIFQPPSSVLLEAVIGKRTIIARLRPRHDADRSAMKTLLVFKAFLRSFHVAALNRSFFSLFLVSAEESGRVNDISN